MQNCRLEVCVILFHLLFGTQEVLDTFLLMSFEISFFFEAFDTTIDSAEELFVNGMEFSVQIERIFGFVCSATLRPIAKEGLSRMHNHFVLIDGNRCFEPLLAALDVALEWLLL